MVIRPYHFYLVGSFVFFAWIVLVFFGLETLAWYFS